LAYLRYARVSKETYYRGKRETYYRGKGDPIHSLTPASIIARERAATSVKRDLL
jgi:hypothetical protein